MIALLCALSMTPSFADDEAFDLSAMDVVVGQEAWGQPISGAAAEERTLQLAAGLRCPVCQGMSVEASTTEAAVAMKARIRELVEQGYTDDQITDYFIARYGVWILLEPQKEGSNWMLYTVPGVIVVMGLVLVFAMQRGRERPVPSAGPTDPTDDYTKRVLAELDE